MRRLASVRGALIVAMALLAPITWHAPLHAEEPAAARTIDPYVDLYAAMDAVTGTEQEFNRHYRFAMEQFRQSPLAQRIGKRDPKAVDAIAAAMLPWIKRHSDRMEEIGKPRYIALMKDQLSPEDASKLAAYCRTERGRNFLLKQFAPERLDGEKDSQASGPRQPLGKPTAFLKPAEGYTPPKPKPAAAPKPAAPEPVEEAVAVVLEDPALQARLTRFFAAVEELTFELNGIAADKDIAEGMARDMDYAASTYGWRLYDRPL
jgi:hypothetical protein